MEYTINSDSSQRTVNLKGRLTFSDHDVFREITQSLSEPGPSTCSVNLSDLEFIDSAGLGLLLLVKEAAQENSLSISLTGASDQVAKMLDITKFNELIDIN
ncbi:STAS domain-containing protein [Magnetovibrio sp. PR-2]|uniref:STAS domain-containing protein n=1 Tax=Magnetovibrio sp. PR-2 TaxID=3120356 RepID=UPI002FCE6504